MKKSLFSLAILGALAAAVAPDRSAFQNTRSGTYSVALAPKPFPESREKRRRNRKGTRK